MTALSLQLRNLFQLKVLDTCVGNTGLGASAFKVPIP